MDASAFFNNPRHSDVVIVLIVEDEPSPDGPEPKRQRTEQGVDVQEGSKPAQQQPAVLQQQGDMLQDGQCLRLPGHNLVLSASSSVISARIEHWSEGDGNELVLHVPSLEVGELLIRCMYQAQPQLQQYSQALLLQLVTLADSLDAHKVAEAASRQLQLFAADPSAELQWETAMQIYSLPPACPEMAAYKPLYKAAARRVQQDLGDLEAVCQDTAVLWPKLLQLPLLVLHQLLSSGETGIASEDTVVYVIQAWAAAQPQQPTQQQMKQLCSTIRLLACRPMYLVSVLSAWPLVVQCFTQQELALAVLFGSSGRALGAMNGLQASAAATAAAAELAELQRTMHSFITSSNSGIGKWWPLRDHRRRSGLGGVLDLQHSVPLLQLEAAVTAALAAGAAAEAGWQEPAAYRWNIHARQGRSFSVWLQAVPATNPPAAEAAAAAAAAEVPAAAAEAPAPAAPDAPAAAAAAAAAEVPASAAGSSTLALSLTFGDDMPQGAVGSGKLRIRVLPAPAGANFDDAAVLDTGPHMAQIKGKEQLGGCLCFEGFCGVSPFSSYAECERQLRQKGLVHPNGTLRLQLQLKILQ